MLVTVVITMVHNCSETALKSSYYLNLVQGIIYSCCHDASNNFLAEKIDSFKRLYIYIYKDKEQKGQVVFSLVSQSVLNIQGTSIVHQKISILPRSKALGESESLRGFDRCCYTPSC